MLYQKNVNVQNVGWAKVNRNKPDISEQRDCSLCRFVPLLVCVCARARGRVRACVSVFVVSGKRGRERGEVCCQCSMVSSLCVRLHEPSFQDGHTNAPTHSPTETRTPILKDQIRGYFSALL